MAKSLPTKVYVIIEGEPYLARAKAWRMAFERAHAAWTAYATHKRAASYIAHQNLSALVFAPGAVLPAGWPAPDAKGQVRPPLHNAQTRAEIAALPTIPDAMTIYGRDVLYTVRWEGEHDQDDYGTLGIGFAWRELTGWIGDTFTGCLPHAGNVAANMLADHPERVIDPAALRWTLPPGLRPVARGELVALCRRTAKPKRNQSRR